MPLILRNLIDMLESEWTRELCKHWETIGVLSIPYIGTECAMNWPDRYITCLLWHGWIEFKNPKTILRDAQWLNILKLQKFGTPAVVVRRTQTRKEENELVKVYVTNPKQESARCSILQLLPTLGKLFPKT